MVSDVWDIELSSLSAIRSLGVKALRVLHLVLKGFREDECPLHASALTFSTLMAIVPVLALSLALARGLGDAETAKNKIRGMIFELTQSLRSEAVATNTSVITGVAAEPAEENGTSADTGGNALPPSKFAAELDRMVDAVFEKVENVNFTALGSVGLVILLCMVVQVLGQVESSFNRVWGITAGRSMWRKFTDYLSVLFVLPILIIAATSLPVVDFVSRFLDESAADRIRSFLGSGALKNLTVVLMTWASFTFVITFMPNTKVRMRPALTGGIVSGLLFILWLRICAAIQVGAVIRYGRIYGSFAVVPIVLAWVYISWAIVLFGAEVAFAVQNCATYRMEQGARRANVQSRIILALSVIAEAGRAMLGKGLNFEAAAYAREKRVPVRLLNDIVEELVQVGYLAELSDNKGCFVLLKPPEGLKVKEVINAVMRSGVKPEALGLASVDPQIEKVIKKAGDGMDESLGQATVQDLI